MTLLDETQAALEAGEESCLTCHQYLIGTLVGDKFARCRDYRVSRRTPRNMYVRNATELRDRLCTWAKACPYYEGGE